MAGWLHATYADITTQLASSFRSMLPASDVRDKSESPQRPTDGCQDMAMPYGATKNRVCDRRQLKQHLVSPTFSFIDPFGFGHNPLEKAKLLMHNEHSELFINF